MRKLGVAAFAAAVIGFAVPAAAHTTSLGYVPGVNAGEVTFWAGSYDHGGIPNLEGMVALNGISVVYSSSQSFNIGPTNTRPAGLVDGTNNFFWGNFNGTEYPFPLNVDPVLFGGVVWWQGVTFSGLSPGTYEFGCGTQCGTTAQWFSLNGAGDVVQLTLTGGDIGGAVPEPSTWAMMLIGFAGLAYVGSRRMRRKDENAARAA